MVIKNGVKKDVEKEIAKTLIEARSMYLKKVNKYTKNIFFQIMESLDLYIPAHIFIIGIEINAFIILINKSKNTHPKNLPIKYSDLVMG